MDKFRDRPARLHLTAEQVNDLRGADVLLPNRPDEIKEVIRERGCDSNQIRLSLAERNITACIPPAKKRKSKRPYNWHLYKKRHPIENMRAKRKDWRRKATRYDRCTHTFIVRNPHRSKRHLLPQRMNAEPSSLSGWGTL
nr:transposase [Komagataeibacter nataicola]